MARHPLVFALRLAAAVGLASASGFADASTKDGYLKAGFDLLGSFDFSLPAPDGTPPTPAEVRAAIATIPAKIKNLNGSRVMVTGYMLPLKLNGTRTTEFLLVSSPMICCYGTVPQMNNWVIVRMGSPGAAILMDSPIQFLGKLHVGQITEDGALAGIYLLDGERMADGQE